MVKAARFCGACGVRIEPKAALQPLKDLACPRCRDALSLCETSGESFAECTGCGGLWLSQEAFERFTRKEQAKAVADFVPTKQKAGEELPPLPREQKIQYLPCPVCSGLMNRKNFATSSGIIVDWCGDHGYWFDIHELEHVQRFVEEGGLDRARARKLAQEKLDLERQRQRLESSKTMLPVGGSRARGWPGGTMVESLGWILTLLFD